jgi:hypothetical protein
MTTPSGAGPTHPNARSIERLYVAIQNANPDAIAACYGEDAYFEDIAFRLRGRKRIFDMWRLICHGTPTVTFNAQMISADDRKGRGVWRANYDFGRTGCKPGRPVDNTLTSEFTFRDGLIVDHRDRSDPVAWARQAFAPPWGEIIGRIGPLRRCLAGLRLTKFIARSKRQLRSAMPVQPRSNDRCLPERT